MDFHEATPELAVKVSEDRIDMCEADNLGSVVCPQVLLKETTEKNPTVAGKIATSRKFIVPKW